MTPRLAVLPVLLASGLTAVVLQGPAEAAQPRCRINDSLFAYTVNYADNARFISIDKNANGYLCIRNNDPHYTGDPATIKVYDDRV